MNWDLRWDSLPVLMPFWDGMIDDLRSFAFVF